jgi:predicted hydrocarbon binding protein
VRGEEIFQELAKMQIERMMQISGFRNRIRKRLGDSVDLLTYQSPLLGALVLAESMDGVLLEAGKKTGIALAAGGLMALRKLPGYRDFAEVSSIEEARLSTGFITLQTEFKSSGTGLLDITKFEKDKLIVYEVRECADCYGIRDLGRSICYFTGGVIGGALEYSLGRKIGFVEPKCRANGDPCCELRYSLVGGNTQK